MAGAWWVLGIFGGMRMWLGLASLLVDSGIFITPRTAPCCHRELLLVVLVLLLLVSLHPPQWTYQRVCRCAAMPKPDCRLMPPI
jgi:hypothetical protein